MKKIFIVENQSAGGWTDGTKSVLGVILDRERRTLKVEQLKGIDLTFAGFIALMKELREELEKVMEGYERKNPFFVRVKEGSSGCRDYDLIVDRTLYDWMEAKGREVNFLRVSQRHLLHLSCAGKCTFPDEFFIPDIPLLLNALLEGTDINEEVLRICLHHIEPWDAERFSAPETACGFEVLDPFKGGFEDEDNDEEE